MTVPDQYFSAIAKFPQEETLPPEKIGYACGALFRDLQNAVGPVENIAWNLRLNVEFDPEEGSEDMEKKVYNVLTCVAQKAK